MQRQARARHPKELPHASATGGYYPRKRHTFDEEEEERLKDYVEFLHRQEAEREAIRQEEALRFVSYKKSGERRKKSRRRKT